MSTPTQHAAVPPTVDRDAWLAARRELLVREKAHTREGDAIAAARRRMPMTEVDATSLVTGPDGPVPFVKLFGEHDQLLVYKHMWHDGQPIEGQCEGCTLSIWHVHDASYLHARGVAYAVVCEGPWDAVAPFVEFMGYTVPWYSGRDAADPAVGAGLLDTRGMFSAYLRVDDRVFLTGELVGRGVEASMTSLALLDLTVYGRQETWQDVPDGWPQPDGPSGWWRRDGRPVAQWTRPGAGAVAGGESRCH